LELYSARRDAATNRRPATVVGEKGVKAYPGSGASLGKAVSMISASRSLTDAVVDDRFVSSSRASYTDPRGFRGKIPCAKFSLSPVVEGASRLNDQQLFAATKKSESRSDEQDRFLTTSRQAYRPFGHRR
jgi:hypothetical protein